MKRNFSGSTAQQAPVWLSGTLQIAFQKPHCSRLTHAFASRKISSREITVEGIEENRLVRSHPITPPLPLRDRDRPTGSGFSGASAIEVIAQRSTSAMRALYQFMNRLMPRLMVRNTSM